MICKYLFFITLLIFTIFSATSSFASSAKSCQIEETSFIIESSSADLAFKILKNQAGFFSKKIDKIDESRFKFSTFDNVLIEISLCQNLDSEKTKDSSKEFGVVMKMLSGEYWRFEDYLDHFYALNGKIGDCFLL